MLSSLPSPPVRLHRLNRTFPALLFAALMMETEMAGAWELAHHVATGH